jgi:hypothetical protein
LRNLIENYVKSKGCFSVFLLFIHFSVVNSPMSN